PEILSWSPDGVVISNGPGDPAAIPQIAATTRTLLDAVAARGTSRPLPILGICLGHQLVARAIGASTSRLPFGHHGANHPVQDLRTGKVAITSQNHEFQVDEASLPPDSGLVVSSRNLNDASVEGLAHLRPIRTPAAGLPSAGHPTIGTAFVVAAGRDGTMWLEEGIGTIRVTSRDGFVQMEQPLPSFTGSTITRQATAEALSLAVEEVR